MNNNFTRDEDFILVQHFNLASQAKKAKKNSLNEKNISLSEMRKKYSVLRIVKKKEADRVIEALK